MLLASEAISEATVDALIQHPCRTQVWELWSYALRRSVKSLMMTWASRELAEEAPEVAPEVGAGGGAGAEEVSGSPEAAALQVSACGVPTSSHKVHLSEVVLAEQNAQEGRHEAGGGSQPWDGGIAGWCKADVLCGLLHV